MIPWALALALGLVLLVTGTLPLGRVGAGYKVAILRPPYGRILGAALILYLIWIRGWGPESSPTLTIIFSLALVLIAMICMVLSLSEKVR